MKKNNINIVLTIGSVIGVFLLVVSTFPYLTKTNAARTEFLWHAPFVQLIFAVLTIFSMFRLIMKHFGTQEFLVEWGKFVAVMFFGIFLLGGFNF